MCFSLTTFAACPAQPYPVDFGGGDNNDPHISITVYRGVFRADRHTDRGRVHPGTRLFRYRHPRQLRRQLAGGQHGRRLSGVRSGGAPFPLLSTGGEITGFCIPDAVQPCFDLSGTPVTAPAGLATAISAELQLERAVNHHRRSDLRPHRAVERGGLLRLHCRCPVRQLPEGVQQPQPPVHGEYRPATPHLPLGELRLGGRPDSGLRRLHGWGLWFRFYPGPGRQHRCVRYRLRPRQLHLAADHVTFAEHLHHGTVDFEDFDGNPIPGIAQGTLDNNGKIDLTPLNLSTMSPFRSSW